MRIFAIAILDLFLGSPLNQYSMDEDAGNNFRIVTTLSSWSGGTNTSTTRLSVLNPSGTVIGSLTDIAPRREFSIESIYWESSLSRNIPTD